MSTKRSWCHTVVRAACLAALAGPSIALAQSPDDMFVRVIPGSRVYFGRPNEVTVDVTIEWCVKYPWGMFDASTRRILLNGVDVSANFTTVGEHVPGCTGPNDFAERSTGTVTLPAHANEFVADARTYENYLASGMSSWFLPKPRRGIAVVSEGQYQHPRPGTSSTARFFVTNTGQDIDTLSVAATCSGAGIASGCTPSPTSLILNAGQTGTVAVGYTAGSVPPDTALIWLEATRPPDPHDPDPAPSDKSWTHVTVTAAPAAGVALVTANDVTERDLCLTIALGADAASECGDLRLAHALPAVFTLGKARVPTLLYNSQHARPSPIVRADVTLPSTGSLPTTVEARVLIGGMQRGFSSWPGSDWGSLGATRRIAVLVDTLATGLYDVTLEVKLLLPGGGTTTYPAAGPLPVVNRVAGHFGAGWWLAGLEELRVLDADRLFWIGGDGSTRLYTKDVTNPSVFRAAKVDRPDSIATISGRYVRWLPGRATVHFDATGRHDSTRSRLGYTTKFAYPNGTSRRLSQLQVPTLSAGHITFAFLYDSATVPAGVLRRVEAPSATTGGPLRETVISMTGFRVDSIRDPDQSRVSFAYATGPDQYLVTSRTNRRGHTTSYAFDAGKRVIRRQITTESGQAIKDSIVPFETRGLPGAAASAAQPLDSTFTLLDGPRTDLTDHTKLWLNAFGAPIRIRNAAGRETRIVRDATWPAYAAMAQGPNRFVTKAWYSVPQGLLDSTRAYGPYSNAHNPKTSYAWDPVWRAVTSVTSPSGIVATFDYDDSTGNRLWQQVGPDSARRVRFLYDSGTRLLRGIKAPLSPAESLSYNALGNVAKTRAPKGFVTLSFSDAIGRDTIVFSPVDTAGKDSASVRNTGAWQRTTYDVMDRLMVATSWGPGVPARDRPADSVRLDHLYDREGNDTVVVKTYRSAGVVRQQHTYSQYDAANRLKAHAPQGAWEQYTLDPAGNAVQTVTRRAHQINTTFDALGRVTRRVLPEVQFGTTICQRHDIGPCVWPTYTLPIRDGNPGACIPADTLVFRYDDAGNMTRADNNAASVRRTHTPAGLIKTDELRIRTYYRGVRTSPCERYDSLQYYNVPERDFTYHMYTLRYAYDAEGRRDTLYHPAAVAPPGAMPQRYAYSSVTGDLTSVTDVKGNSVSFDYDAAGRLWHRTYPGGVTLEHEYDHDGNVHFRALSSTPLTETLVRDARGRVVAGTASPASGEPAQTIAVEYHGLGAVVYAAGLSGLATWEEFDTDGLGNRQWHRAVNFDPQRPDARRTFQYWDNGSIEWIRADTTVQPASEYDFFQQFTNDGNGSQDWSLTYEWKQCGGEFGYCRTDEQMRSYFGADDMLRIFNRHVGISQVSQAGGVYEEYRYDALGRRVLVRSRTTTGCSDPNSLCGSYIERTIWDGDQVLYEIRAPGKDGTNYTIMEADNNSSSGIDGYLIGTVVYAHGPEIDQPLTVLRLGLDYLSGEFVLAPHANWQGDYEIGTLMNGAVCPGTGSCPPVSWPGNRITVDGALPGSTPPASWFGSLLALKADQSGLQYMRNRYYNPKTGQFTQEDPIGPAGGLNLYGFANGDPINFSDPFGLCPSDGSENDGISKCEDRVDSPEKEKRDPSQQGTRQGFGVLSQVGTPEKPEYAAIYLAVPQTGPRPQVLAANVTFSDKPGVVGLLRLELQGEGLIRGRYKGTLTFENKVFAATINIDRLGLIEFGALKAVPKVR